MLKLELYVDGEEREDLVEKIDMASMYELLQNPYSFNTLTIKNTEYFIDEIVVSSGKLILKLTIN